VTAGPPRVFADDQCGPGSLAAVLNALGDPVTGSQLEVELPAVRGGVLSLDLVLAARRRGFSAALLRGDPARLRLEIEAGRAAILMLRLLDMPGQARDVYHYVVVDGFDPERSFFRFQFGDGQARWALLDDLESSWKAAGHALVQVARGTPSLADGLRRGLALEREGRWAEAAEVYRQLDAAHPRSVRVLVNLGNAEAAGGRRAAAEAAYRAALEIGPEDQDALNNLAWLLLADPSRLEEAEDLAARAAKAGGPDRAPVLDTLGRILLARGHCREAEEVFGRALAEEALPERLRAGLTSGQEAARVCSAPGPTRDR
jgi:tetratricopeptide (TPR) repeat protein